MASLMAGEPAFSRIGGEPHRPHLGSASYRAASKTAVSACGGRSADAARSFARATFPPGGGGAVRWFGPARASLILVIRAFSPPHQRAFFSRCRRSAQARRNRLKNKHLAGSQVVPFQDRAPLGRSARPRAAERFRSRARLFFTRNSARRFASRPRCICRLRSAAASCDFRYVFR